MKNKLIEFLREKANQYLPSEEPETEAEKIYEEGKKRVYELHRTETDLFYVENVWTEDGKLHIYGEFARGDFMPGQEVEFLDNYAEHLCVGCVEEVHEEQPGSVAVKRGFLKTTPKIYLILSCEEKGLCPESFVYTNFVIKRRNG